MDKRLFHAAATFGVIISAPFLLVAVVPEGTEIPALFLGTVLVLASLLAFGRFLPTVPPEKKSKRRR